LHSGSYKTGVNQVQISYFTVSNPVLDEKYKLV